MQTTVIKPSAAIRQNYNEISNLAKETQEQAWSVRTLQRNVSSQYYYRMLMSQNTELVEKEMKELTASYQKDKLEFIKNPVIAEFLGLASCRANGYVYPYV